MLLESGSKERNFDEEFKNWKIKMKTTTYSMVIKCGWCNLDMGNKPCEKDQHNMISHSICPTCKKKVMEEVI